MGTTLQDIDDLKQKAASLRDELVNTNTALKLATKDYALGIMEREWMFHIGDRVSWDASTWRKKSTDYGVITDVDGWLRPRNPKEVYVIVTRLKKDGVLGKRTHIVCVNKLAKHVRPTDS